MIRFKSFSSGSCGNCYFIGIFNELGAAEAGIVIDAGVSPKTLKRSLAEEGLCFDDIDAVLITHDHGDHIRSLGSFCKHIGKPVYATSTLHAALRHHPYSRDWIGGYAHELDEGWNKLCGGRVSVRSFIVPHDATQTSGYAILLDGYRFVIMTDVGRVTKEALDLASQADTLVIEANYDPWMLAHGPYPPELQERISSGHGHISNPECAEAVRKALHPELRNIFLCHLSEHNNTPELARDCVAEVLKGLENPPRMLPLPRRTASPLYFL